MRNNRVSASSHWSHERISREAEHYGSCTSTVRAHRAQGPYRCLTSCSMTKRSLILVPCSIRLVPVGIWVDGSAWSHEYHASPRNCMAWRSVRASEDGYRYCVGHVRPCQEATHPHTKSRDDRRPLRRARKNRESINCVHQLALINVQSSPKWPS